MLLAALWFSSSNPSMSTFLRPLMDSINQLYYKGNSMQFQMMCLHLTFAVIQPLPTGSGTGKGNATAVFIGPSCMNNCDEHKVI